MWWIFSGLAAATTVGIALFLSTGPLSTDGEGQQSSIIDGTSSEENEIQAESDLSIEDQDGAKFEDLSTEVAGIEDKGYPLQAKEIISEKPVTSAAISASAQDHEQRALLDENSTTGQHNENFAHTEGRQNIDVDRNNEDVRKETNAFGEDKLDAGGKLGSSSDQNQIHDSNQGESSSDPTQEARNTNAEALAGSKRNDPKEDLTKVTELDYSQKENRQDDQQNSNEINPDYESSRRFNLMLSFGAGVSYRSLSSQLAPNLINHRNQHEKLGFTQNYGLAGQIGLFKRSFLRVGLYYQKYTDRYDFTNAVIQHRSVNDYAYIQLPVLYGHKIVSFGANSDLFALGGLKFNRLYAAQSSWVDPDLFQAIAHNNKVDVETFKKWAYVLKFGFEYRRRLGQNWNMHLTPTVDGFVNSVYENSEFLNQKPYSFQMNFGLSYRF